MFVQILLVSLNRVFSSLISFGSFCGLWRCRQYQTLIFWWSGHPAVRESVVQLSVHGTFGSSHKPTLSRPKAFKSLNWLPERPRRPRCPHLVLITGVLIPSQSAWIGQFDRVPRSDTVRAQNLQRSLARIVNFILYFVSFTVRLTQRWSREADCTD